VYKWCSEDPTPPCDQVKGDLIISGGQLRLHFGRVVIENGMPNATAFVRTSSDPNFPRGSDQKFMLDRGVITWTGSGMTFCGAKAPAGSCGA